MASVSKQVDNITTLVQSLPQELIDAIFAYTITLSHKKHIGISSGYTPPSPLHLNRSIREKFAVHFYANTIFHSSSEKLLAQWLTSLPSEHRNLLQKVRLIVQRRSQGDGKGEQRKSCDCYRDDLKRRLLCEGVEVEDVRFLTIWT